MPHAPTDAVVAGSKAFALALFAPLTERAAARPRVAADPAQAQALCQGSTGILVLEYDARWLPVLRQLRRQEAGLRIVAALPRGMEAAALHLGPLGVEAVPWDGQPATVMPAVERLLAAPAAPAPAVTTAPAVAVPAPRPAAAAAPRPVPSAPLAPKPTAPPPGVARPVNPAPPVVRPAPVRAPAPATAPAAAAAPAAAPASPPAPAPAQAPLPSEDVDLFGDVDAAPAPPADDPFARAAADPLAEVESAPTPPPYLFTPPARAAVWPATAPSLDEAEQALRGALAGRPVAGPLAPVAQQAVAAMTQVERAAVGGAPVEVDPGPLRRAAVSRLRVGAAIASRPAAGSPVDAAAVEALLAELDGHLTRVNGLLAGAPDALKPSLELVRNALVKEAVDFSEACHAAGGAAPAAAAPAAPAPTRAAAAARVLSVQAGADEQTEAEERRSRAAWILLAVALLGAAGFHGWRWWTREQAIAELRTLPGAPDGMMLLPSAPGTPRTLIPVRGPPDRTQVEKFKAQQSLVGNEVTELQGGGLVVAPRPEPRPEGERRTP